MKRSPRSTQGLFLLAAIGFSDLLPAAREIIQRLGVSPETFPALVRQMEVETAARERAGEGDHLIYYILQSRQFTGAAAVEPALSAKEFVESGKTPAVAVRRFEDFLKARVVGERMTHLRRMVPAPDGLAFLDHEYARAMHALYAKEFGDSDRFYQTRGHSTDTQVPANYAVWTALSVLHAAQPGMRMNRVLIVGPGLDFAPRTGLDESHPPQSYQPYAIADALIGSGLSADPAIHCVDINDRVIDFFHEFPGRRPPVLYLVSPPGDRDYMGYFGTLGNAIGEVRRRGSLDKEVYVRPHIAARVTAQKLNVVTERLTGWTQGYDLVVATNVFVYFSDRELLLALSNLASVMGPGAYLVHNEVRPEMELYARAAGLTPVAGRTIRVAEGAKAPLYDAFNILRK